MKSWLSSNRLFVLGFAILIATNGVVLFGIASNRSEGPESLITLTERELQIPYASYPFDKENSGLSLEITFQSLAKNEKDNIYSDFRSPFWFTAEKLKELGFKIQKYSKWEGDNDFFKRQVSKEVFLVLEYDGESFKKAMERAEQAVEKAKGSLRQNPDDKGRNEVLVRAEDQLMKQSVEKSRLFAIDAGLDLMKLRQAYPDKGRYLIARGIVEPFYGGKNEDVFGHIQGLSISDIYVPLKYRDFLDMFLRRERSTRHDTNPPRYEVELAFGSRLEPWIVSVHSIEKKPE